MSVLPKEINYTSVKSLPDGTSSNSIVTAPINGSSFGASSIIQFDLVQRGYMVPESMYIRYKLECIGGVAIGANWIRATPVYTMFARSEVICGSQVIESIQNYNQLCNMLVNCKMNYAQKVGLSNSFGYTSSVTDQYLFNFSNESPNGSSLSTLTNANVAAAGTLFLAAPLGNILSNSDHLVPLKFMPSCRIQLTTEALSNAFQLAAIAANAVQSYTITNCELCYDIIEFSPTVDQAITSMGNGSITLKSQSYLSSGVTVAGTSSGTLEFLFNQRLASIKSVFAHLSGTVANATNGFFDSIDITTNNGDYQFFISGMPYPPRPLSTFLNKAAISMELSSAFGPAHDLLTSNFSINPTEFGAINNGLVATSQNQMAKFYVGTNVEKLSTNGTLLTGISSQGSPISCRISLGTATVGSQVLQLICLYDALIQIDIASRTIVVMQ